MKIILDTHIFLWFITNNKRLADQYYDAISNQDNEIYLSVVSVWEATIKYQLGKLPLPASPEIYLPQQREKHLISSLSITETTITQLAKLPPVHNDPFDRLLLCQSLEHDFIIMTEDKAILSYSMVKFF
ncbi:type II toxin-antitoxin system VapC family toxin [Sphaerospermopsis sp. FACHB-1094]|jgi:PIN domain nuclease of toxin-antitoxin system|uniref:Type II toxin-antitoxin system VapC family toxin n=1 Tax=Sphaerospermopsis aphanizomenoides LEGE 00250 TaxID=2777972 RepID=A0ABR9VDB7_9CYAN|nr:MULTISPECIES: type II toxin-antitoxin system VapC family toxin [Sphaerospermopsis]MBD2134350.1 type II toxin-antitoxin system VapC family toxin [Sphaerospermopsis sp. FACHB-1094]MBE9236478.1 type II toxin-antitoxin system VapC family toxin [Sphaerospermopsis aphanizomenoides LEGE 00250]